MSILWFGFEVWEGNSTEGLSIITLLFCFSRSDQLTASRKQVGDLEQVLERLRIESERSAKEEAAHRSHLTAALEEKAAEAEGLRLQGADIDSSNKQSRALIERLQQQLKESQLKAGQLQVQ